METEAVGVELMLGHINEGIQKLNKPSMEPLTRQLITAGKMPASGAANLIIPHMCPYGRVWDVNRVGIYGADGHTVVASAVADIYFGPRPDVTDFSAQLVTGSAVPYIESHGRYHWTGESGYYIYAFVYGAAANTQLVLAASVLEYPVEAQRGMTI